MISYADIKYCISFTHGKQISKLLWPILSIHFLFATSSCLESYDFNFQRMEKSWEKKWPLRKVYKSSSSLVRWDPLNWIFQPVRGARKISVSCTWTGLTVWTVMMPETPSHFIPIQRHQDRDAFPVLLMSSSSSESSPSGWSSSSSLLSVSLISGRL